MVHKLHEDFLDEPDAYRACEAFWQRLVIEVARSAATSSDWRPWIPRRYADGTPMELDGNPICDGRSDRLDRGYRVIQQRAETDELEISAWLKSYEEEYTELPRHELVIFLALSEESARLADALLRKWMAPETTPAVMQTLLAELTPSEGSDQVQ